jgi:phosphatidylserine/phosphatidylglycerophosphate/cardiolipin synthase-like enzyme
MSQTEYIIDRQIYDKVICEAIPNATSYVWIATSDLKDLYVSSAKKMVPFLQVVSDLIGREVSVRLIHAKEPGPAFREDFDKYPNLIDGLERLMCPRAHFKCVVVDGTFAYSGSANLTGAGMGAKSSDRRNFESGLVTRDPQLIKQIAGQFDRIWMGEHCPSCDRKTYCTEYKDMV